MGDVLEIVTRSSLIVTFILQVGCANMQTIDRTTTFPPGKSIGVHLDAQQRLVLSTAKGICAEPSPDALSAYASSLGLSIIPPGEGQLSVTKALQGSTGGIGLRTQSITLMRDALYRICEASNNGHLSEWEIAASLRRSQDLTAVILAVEQLTSATVARPVTLTASTRAGTSESPSEPKKPVNQEENKASAQATLQPSNQQAIERVALAVKTMVQQVLDKSYLVEMCFSYMAPKKDERTTRVCW